MSRARRTDLSLQVGFGRLAGGFAFVVDSVKRLLNTCRYHVVLSRPDCLPNVDHTHSLSFKHTHTHTHTQTPAEVITSHDHTQQHTRTRTHTHTHAQRHLHHSPISPPITTSHMQTHQLPLAHNLHTHTHTHTHTHARAHAAHEPRQPIEFTPIAEVALHPSRQRTSS